MPVVVTIIAYLWNKTFNCKFVKFNMCQGTYLLVLDTHRCFIDTIDNPHLSTARLLVLLSLREKREGSEATLQSSRTRIRAQISGFKSIFLPLSHEYMIPLRNCRPNCKAFIPVFTDNVTLLFRKLFCVLFTTGNFFYP